MTEKVLIIGGSGGIGQAFVKWHLATSEKTICILDPVDRNSNDTLISDLRVKYELWGHGWDGIKRDIDAERLNELMADASILIHCGGIISRKPISEVDFAEMDRYYQTFISSTQMLIRAIAQQYPSEMPRKLIGISSGLVGHIDNARGAYIGANSWQSVLFRSFRKECQEKGWPVTVLEAMPGPIMTENTRTGRTQQQLEAMWKISMDPDNFVQVLLDGFEQTKQNTAHWRPCETNPKGEYYFTEC